jgi:hypothetical protein
VVRGIVPQFMPVMIGFQEKMMEFACKQGYAKSGENVTMLFSDEGGTRELRMIQVP